MSKLVWNQDGDKLYQTGVDNGVLFTKKNGTYGKGVSWIGLTSVTESPSGADDNKFYADNGVYGSLRAAEEFGGTIEAYSYPEEFAECDGSAAPVKGVTIGQQARLPFAFSYRTKIGNDTDGMDHGYLLHIVYNATASPSERQYQTVNDSPEAITFGWDFSTTPVHVDGFKPTALITIDSTKADATKLKALEDKLYGTDSTESELPTPSEVITMMQPST